LHWIRNVRAASRAPFESLIRQLRKNRAAVRVSVAAVSLALVFMASQQGVSRAGPEPRAAQPVSILPANIGVGVSTDSAVTVSFDRAMDRASVEAGLSVLPETPLAFSWSADSRLLEVRARKRWMTDERYLLLVPGSVRALDGSVLSTPRRLSFTTATAPVVSDFQLRYVGPTSISAKAVVVAGTTTVDKTAAGKAAIRRAELLTQTDTTVGLAGGDRLAAGSSSAPSHTASNVSARTSVTIWFSSAMNPDDVAANFTISPSVAGRLSWVGTSLTFTPSARLTAGRRYAISLAGVHDRVGNPLGGDTSFSFTTIDGAQVVRVRPQVGSRDVTRDPVEVWFSRPMQIEKTLKAFQLTDLTAKRSVPGKATWNKAGTQLIFAPSASLARGHAFEIRVGKGAVDADGNALNWSTRFSTKAPPPPPPAPVIPPPAAPAAAAPVLPAPAPSSSAAGYALNQVNSARSAYGFRGLALSGDISAVASAHAWDMLRYGYFSHTGRDGSTVRTRLTAGGVAYSYAGENICQYSGMSVTATLSWCHSQFMSEPYPGYFNHIGNILDPDFTRLGMGIATGGGRVVIVWDFAG